MSVLVGLALGRAAVLSAFRPHFAMEVTIAVRLEESSSLPVAVSSWRQCLQYRQYLSVLQCGASLTQVDYPLKDCMLRYECASLGHTL